MYIHNTINTHWFVLQEPLSKVTTLLKQDHDESPDASDKAEAADQSSSADAQHGTEYSIIYYVVSYSTTLMLCCTCMRLMILLVYWVIKLVHKRRKCLE